MQNILLNAAFFKGVAPGALDEIAGFCSEITFIEGDEITTGDRLDNRNLYLLYAGNLEVLLPDGLSMETVLNENSPELVGEIAWLTGGKRSTTLRCISEVDALLIDGVRLTGWLNANPESGVVLLRNLAVLLARRLMDKELLMGFQT